MIRLNTAAHKGTSWVPNLEGPSFPLPGLPAGKVAGHQSHNINLKWSDYQDQGVVHLAGCDDTPNVNRNVIPGSIDARAYAVARLNGKVAAEWTEDEAYLFGRYWLGENGNKANNDMFRAGAIGGIIAGQFREAYGVNEPYRINEDMPLQWNALWRGIRENAEAQTPQGILIGDYDTKYNPYFDLYGEGGPFNPNTAANRQSLLSPANARYNVPWFNDPLSRYINPIFQVYPKSSNRYQIYEAAYALFRLGLGSSDWGFTSALKAIAYWWPSLEGADTNNVYVPRFFWGKDTLGGTLYSQNQAWYSFGANLTILMYSMIYGGGFASFSSSGRYTPDESRLRTTDEGATLKWWYSPSGAPKPANASLPNFPPRPHSPFNATYMAHYLAGNMFAQAGSNYSFRPFKIGSGPFINPSDVAPGITMLESMTQNRGWVNVGRNGDYYWVFYTNPFAPESGEIVTVDIGDGRMIQFDAFGVEPVCICGKFDGSLFYGRTNSIRGVGATNML